MEEKGYKQLITLIFEDLNNLLRDESLTAFRKIYETDEAYKKAEKLNNEFVSLLDEYRLVKREIIDITQFLTQDSIQKRDFIIYRCNLYKKKLNRKKEIIKIQLEALYSRELDQQELLAGYGILHKKKHTINPVTTKMLYKILDLPADTELFGGTDQ